MEVCPTCGREAPCTTCGDAGDLVHLEPREEQIELGRRMGWFGHMLRRSYMAAGMTVAAAEAEEITRRVDELVAATRDLGVH